MKSYYRTNFPVENKGDIVGNLICTYYIGHTHPDEQEEEIAQITADAIAKHEHWAKENRIILN